MICHVWEKAVKADLGPVFVATDSPEIVAAVEGIGGRLSLHMQIIRPDLIGYMRHYAT